MPHYDLAIVGSGSGNTIVNYHYRDWRVAFIEQGTFGGTCINVGCIPTKMYVYPADLARTVSHEAARLGVDTTLDGIRWREIRDRIFGRIDAISSSGRDYRREGSNSDLYEVHADFVAPREVKLASGETITADQFVLALGSRAVVPKVVLDSGVEFHTSDTVMRIDALPRRAAILGGGYIAAEFAHIFSAFGVRITQIARSAPLLRHLDNDLATAFTAQASEQWDVRLGRVLTALHQDADGIHLDLDDGARVDVDLLLVATGRVPNSDRMNLAAAGVDTHPDGRIAVDEFQRTTAAGVWALGDVSSAYQLKHVANHEARTVQHNLLHPDDLRASDHRFVPAAIFTHPQIASVGMTEEQARATGRQYVTASLPYGSTAYGWAMEDTTSFCKVIADPGTGLLLGAHIMGYQASSLIQPLIQAMSFGQRAHDIARGQYWIHPALMEVIENALLQLHLK